MLQEWSKQLNLVFFSAFIQFIRQRFGRAANYCSQFPLKHAFILSASVSRCTNENNIHFTADEDNSNVNHQLRDLYRCL